MNKRRLQWYFFVFALIQTPFFSCQNDQPLPYAGTWQATELWETGQKMEVDTLMEKVVLNLNNDKSYSFISTLNKKESGKYRIKRKKIYIQSQEDLVNRQERIMEIITLDKDSMHLKMTDNGKERVLKFCKV